MLPEQARTLLDKIIEDAEPGEPAPFRALTRPRLRPYLWDAHTLRVLAAGLGVITRAALRLTGRGLRAAFTRPPEKPPAKTEKPSSEEGKDAKVAKKESPKKTGPTLADSAEQAAIGILVFVVAGIVLAGALAAVGPRVAPYLPAATLAGLVVLVIAAFMVAPEVPRKSTKHAEPEQPDGLPDAPGDTPEGRRLVFLWWLEKTTRGEAGIHLDQMHLRLTQWEPGRDIPRHYLRPLLEHYGIPVQRTLRVGPVSGRTGVSREAIEAALRAPSETPPPEAGREVVERAESVPDLHESSGSTGAPQSVDPALSEVV